MFVVVRWILRDERGLTVATSLVAVQRGLAVTLFDDRSRMGPLRERRSVWIRGCPLLPVVASSFVRKAHEVDRFHRALAVGFRSMDHVC